MGLPAFHWPGVLDRTLPGIADFVQLTGLAGVDLGALNLGPAGRVDALLGIAGLKNFSCEPEDPGTAVRVGECQRSLPMAVDSDHEEGDGRGEDAGQDGDRVNGGSHREPLREASSGAGG
jgi:hypothetical protein